MTTDRPTPGSAEMSTLFARISMRELEYSLTLNSTLQAIAVQLFDRFGRKSDRRLCAGRWWWTLVVGNAQDIPFGAAATEPCQQGASVPDGGWRARFGVRAGHGRCRPGTRTSGKPAASRLPARCSRHRPVRDKKIS